jgi:hypothetical protein
MTFDRRPKTKTASLDPLGKKLINTAGKALNEIAGYASSEIYELEGDFNTPEEQKRIARLNIVFEKISKMQELLEDAEDALDY